MMNVYIKKMLVHMATQAAEQLSGTCNTIASLGEEYESLELNTIFCNRLDELVFCCTVCDWWCEQSEMSNEDWVCDECFNEG